MRRRQRPRTSIVLLPLLVLGCSGSADVEVKGAEAIDTATDPSPPPGDGAAGTVTTVPPTTTTAATTTTNTGAATTTELTTTTTATAATTTTTTTAATTTTNTGAATTTTATTDGTDEPPELTGTLPTEALRDRIVAVTDSLDFQAPDDLSLADASLEPCPVDDHDALLTRVFGEVIPDDVGVTRDGATIVTRRPGIATRLPITGIDLVGCGSDNDGEHGVGIDFAVAPPDVTTFLREFNDPDSLGDLVYDVTPTTSAFGGLVVRARVVAEDDPDFTSDDVIWIDDEVLVTAYLFGAELADVDLDLVERNLLAELPTLVETAFR